MEAEQLREPDVRIYLLGGFRVEQHGEPVADAAWGQRRLARTLIKLLAVERTHSLHRDQILELLWPDVGMDAALNGFSKALHAARRALEPDLQPRQASQYLRLSDDILSLNHDRVWIDIDHFEDLAEEAGRVGDIATYEAASSLYTGELLPEDRYEDWAEDRRTELRDARSRLLLALADALIREGSEEAAADYLRQVVQEDPTREDVHRSLMRLYAEMGSRHEALRQYQVCCQVLERELDVEPDTETERLYQDILANRIEQRVRPTERVGSVMPVASGLEIPEFPVPLVGRDRVLEHLMRDLTRAEAGQGRLVMIGGEAGVGKRRLAMELAREAQQRDARILWGVATAGGDDVPYGPFIAALDSYLSRVPVSEREALATAHPGIAGLIPSLVAASPAPQTAPTGNSLTYPLVRLLTDIANAHTLLLILEDLHAADQASLQLLEYLAPLSLNRRWLLIATYREEDMTRGNAFHRMLAGTQRQAFCLHMELRRLARADCDRLLRGLLPDGEPTEDVLEQVYSLTLGNPLFVEELVQAMRELGQLALADGQWVIADASTGKVPQRIRDLVELRLVHLDTDVRRILAMAASIDSGFSFETLRNGAAALYPPVPDIVLLESLDRAVQARILVEHEDGYAFRHPLVRQTLADGLSRHRRARIQDALSRPGNAPDGRHDGNDRRGARPVLAPGRRATDNADELVSVPGEEAARRYGELLDRLDLEGAELEAAEVRRKLAAVLTSLGRYSRAAHVLRQALATYDRNGDAEAKRTLEAQVSLLDVLRNNPGQTPPPLS